MTIERAMFPRCTRKTENTDVRSAYLDLEPIICDVARLCEMTDDLNHHWLDNPGDDRRGAHATLMSEILLERVIAFKSKYYAGFGEAPDADGK